MFLIILDPSVEIMEPSKERNPIRTALLLKAKELATTPGVYLMKNAEKQVLYVGKAKSLKNRVTSYFQPVVHELGRIELLLTSVLDFEVILTETESEALILECSLIKRYKPKFNIRLKDDKHFPYIKIRVDQDFPRLEWTRKVRSDGARYFGPFASAYLARLVLSLLNESYRLRDCSDNTFSHRSRPCILFQMDQCSAPCVKQVTAEEYHKQIGQAVQVLEGKGTELLSEIEAQMSEAASEERFEDAARARDQLHAIRVITETQAVSQPGREVDRDVFASARKGTEAQGVVLQVRGGKLLAVKHYYLQNVDDGIPESELLVDFLSQHFLLEETQSEGNFLQRAKEVLLSAMPDDLELIERTFGVQVYLPDGEADQRLVQVAQTNAKHALEQGEKRSSGHGYAALDDVMKKLNLDHIPRRIECFDISNTGGEEAVASRVVFIDGSPEKELYRRYKIKTVFGSNDFAMMREVLGRRLSRIEEEKPDLIVVDGGKGQLSQAVAVLEDLNIQGVALAGLAKARTEGDFQSKEVKGSMERIFLPNRVNPVVLLPHTKAFQLLTHVRDEAHRFAISYHRLLRDKKSMGRG